MPDRTPLSDDAIADALAGLDGWSLDADRLVRTWAFDSFREAFAFLTRVAFEAEAMDHHPEITNVYGRVTLALATHDAGDRVTDTDVALARRLSAL
jgi:4a-hydroxytetrahydrobiopterin dehydratase